MQEENALDRQLRFRERLKHAFLWGYLLAMPGLLIVGIVKNDIMYGALVIALAAAGKSFAGNALVHFAFDHVPALWRWWRYKHWHGSYREYEGFHVRIIDGEGNSPSIVLAYDILRILGMSTEKIELAKLKARYGDDFLLLTKEEFGEAVADEWAFTDEACAKFLAGHANSGVNRQRTQDALRLSNWLAREVFMPIDNKRTRDTGRNYRWTSTGRHGNG